MIIQNHTLKNKLYYLNLKNLLKGIFIVNTRVIKPIHSDVTFKIDFEPKKGIPKTWGRNTGVNEFFVHNVPSS